METLEQRIRRVTREDVAIIPYDPRWPDLFRREKEHLLSCLPRDLVRRVEHFGSTAVPGLAAKPVVDVLVEVSDLEATKPEGPGHGQPGREADRPHVGVLSLGY